jgi:signal transduction histidine kinase/AraC-like DNA-binding protein
MQMCVIARSNDYHVDCVWSNRKSFQSSFLWLLVCLVFISFSCQPEQKEKMYTIGFSQCTNYDNWRKTMLAEMYRELSFHNNVKFLYKDAEGNSEVQSKQIDSLVKENIDLLIVSPNEVKPLSATIRKVYNKGIPVVLVDRRIDSAKYTAYVGASNYEIGEEAGRYAVSLLKGSGNLIEIAGLQAASPFIDRHRGFMDVISQYPDIHYIKEIQDHSPDYPQDLQHTLLNNPTIDLVFAQSDYLAHNAYEACKKLGLDNKIKIIGIDGLPMAGGGLDMVANKQITSTILYPTGGQEAIQTAINILERKPYDKENHLITTVIDSSNVRIMRQQYDKMIVQQKDIDKKQRQIEQKDVISQHQTTIIYTISLTLAMALIFGIILFFSLRENRKINSRLVRSLNENKNINTKLTQQNEEISEQRNQLIELGKQAEEASAAKINFFTNISHEFRTPLTLILAPLEEMKQGKLDAANKQYITIIQKNAIRLLKLVNELMDFRKIEAGKMQLHVSENDIVQFTDAIINTFKSLAKKRNIDVRLIAKHKSLPVWFDTSMLDKVIFNLLSNAFKFTGDNGFIYVTIEKNETDQTAIIKVEDNGIGMSQDVADHVFELFYQGGTSDQLGSGLGLSLSKELIQLHHGNITVKSEPGKGTVFTITLPLSKTQFQKNEFLDEKLSQLDVYYDDRIFAQEQELMHSDNNPVNQEQISDKTILVVEDNNDLRNYLKKKLRNHYTVIEAENGITAIQLAFDNVPDLIISDIALPGKDGIAITNTLKSDIRTSHIPIILLTAKSETQHQIEGMKSMADAYVVKPFHFPFLEETIRSVMRNRDILKEHYTSELPVELKSSVPKKLDKKFINDFAAVVENNIGNEAFTVEEICKAISVSRIQLYRKVKALLGVNVNDYILTARLQKAKYLLSNEDLTIAEVAFQVGFASSTYFATVFKNRLSVTPSEYKDKTKG